MEKQKDYIIVEKAQLQSLIKTCCSLYQQVLQQDIKGVPFETIVSKCKTIKDLRELNKEVLK